MLPVTTDKEQQQQAQVLPGPAKHGTGIFGLADATCQLSQPVLSDTSHVTGANKTEWKKITKAARIGKQMAQESPSYKLFALVQNSREAELVGIFPVSSLYTDKNIKKYTFEPITSKS